ncbi:MAG: peptidylprolyl isomerase, partial [Candidatus Kerfeldbacteria bacterium]|nr:peptidylprolyl isomerase [Candidatus Kerfeldbacteria bacterium]
MRKFAISLIPLVLLLTGAACDKKGTNTVERTISNPPGALVELAAADLANKQATLQTSQGEIVIELFGPEAPIAVSNFITLTNKKFYDGLKFHRYVANFVIQGGDPQGTGYGGPGYTFIDEPVTKDYTAGIVAMANSGPDTNGSQFFIVLENQPSLPKSYTIFGRVTSGLENVKKLRAGDTITSVTIGELSA